MSGKHPVARANTEARKSCATKTRGKGRRGKAEFREN